MSRSRCTLLSAAIVAALLAPFASSESIAAEPDRGKALYGERCDGCHAESVHGRTKRVARDFDAVRGWVKRWSDTLKVRWSEQDVEDVTTWLNSTYYGYPCPPAVCKVLSLSTPEASR